MLCQCPLLAIYNVTGSRVCQVNLSHCSARHSMNTRYCMSSNMGTAVAHRSPETLTQHSLRKTFRSAACFIQAPPKVSTPQQESVHRCIAAFATKPTVIPSPSYAIPLSLGGIAAVAWLTDVKALAGIAGILGLFLAIQASRVKFVFDDEALVRSCNKNLSVSYCSLRMRQYFLYQSA